MLSSQQMRQRPTIPDAPTFAPSWEVHITKTAVNGRVNTSVETPRYWAIYGYGLKSVISQAWGMRDNRIFADADVDTDALYDFALVPPHEIDEEERFKILRDAVARQFEVRVVREKRKMEVDVLSAPQGKGPGLRELLPPDVPPGMGAIAGSGLGGTNRQLSSHDATMEDLCDLLEGFEKTIVLDETNLTGHYAVNAKGDGDLRKMLKDELGLVLTKNWREIEVLRVERK